MKNKIIAALLGISSVVFAQEAEQVDPNLALPKLTYLDSLKSTFINHNTSSCIDERWMAELSNEDIFQEMLTDVTETNIDSLGNINYDLSTDLLKKRLVKLDAQSPFNIEYTPALENVIKAFLKNRKGSLERLMAISEYYFPMFEEHLAKYNVPLEIKYLAIVESALNPKARSRVGATGLWQFMYPTGKQYNLEVNSYVDERYDPLKATEAACQYLSNLYGIFGDWSLVLASYNAGPGNVSKAIRRSGGSQNYWNIRRNLPRETANYVPAFLATMYIFEYKKEHGLQPKKATASYFETDTIAVKRELTFKQISELLDISEEQIEFLNPIYKLNVIPFVEGKQHYIRLPKNKLGLFLSNEEKVYAYADYQNSLKEKISVANTAVANNSSFSSNSGVQYHKIKRGESIGLIADKYNVSVTELKRWNKLRSNTIQAGKTLKIYSDVKTASVTTQKASAGGYYTVQPGDSLFSIARKYPGISADDLKKWNDISGDNIQPGMKLKTNG
ncbi:lytic transglycosylase domain-containing protein [Flavobacterium haoranii]|uniref:Membrane-bound lytic murein transglycosylase D n=1 Tax=Flavobacterium haoranii TaxID=683124 RepID=A0A1M6ELC6_9FLAO|nr:lytic transglycosylase domain-containing protein [Flavobacterium haoranii]SHI86291.1 membrane-bound lytic murein transglycosylase D [Flavobacterium haoranii]